MIKLHENSLQAKESIKSMTSYCLSMTSSNRFDHFILFLCKFPGGYILLAGTIYILFHQCAPNTQMKPYDTLIYFSVIRYKIGLKHMSMQRYFFNVEDVNPIKTREG